MTLASPERECDELGGRRSQGPPRFRGETPSREELGRQDRVAWCDRHCCCLSEAGTQCESGGEGMQCSCVTLVSVRCARRANYIAHDARLADALGARRGIGAHTTSDPRRHTPTTLRSAPRNGTASGARHDSHEVPPGQAARRTNCLPEHPRAHVAPSLLAGQANGLIAQPTWRLNGWPARVTPLTCPCDCGAALPWSWRRRAAA